MKKDAYRALVNETFEEIIILSMTKGEEYSNNDDQLANFKRLSIKLGLTPEQVLLVYLTKHLDSIDHYVKTQSINVISPIRISEPIEGRIDDAINYLCLLKGLIQERTGLQEQASLVADRPSRSRPKARGQERELRTRLVDWLRQKGLVAGSEVLQEAASYVIEYSPLHPGADGVAGEERRKGSGEVLSIGGVAADGIVTGILPTPAALGSPTIGRRAGGDDF